MSHFEMFGLVYGEIGVKAMDHIDEIDKYMTIEQLASIMRYEFNNESKVYEKITQ